MSRVSRLVSLAWRRDSSAPAADPTGFYRVTAPGDGRGGELLARARLDAAPGVHAWRIQYRTHDAAGRPVVASAAIAAPADTADRARPIVVWVHGAVGVAAGCGPSRAGLDVPYASEVLAAGGVVVAPDLTGLGMEGVVHPYLHGTTAGRSVLDAALAATELPATGAGPVTTLAGYSAGGHAALWAAQLAATGHGEGLRVQRVVAVAPVGDLAVAVHHYATTAGHAAFAVQVAATWPGVEPVDAADVLTAAGLRHRDVLERSCLGGVMATYRGDASRWLRADGFRTGAWAAALDTQSAGRVAPGAPVAVIHGADDSSVLPAWSERLVDDLRRAGGHAELRICSGADHGGVLDGARGEVVELLVG